METDFKVAFKRGTPEHTSAFPQGREPFQRGGMGSRKTALDAFILRTDQLRDPLNDLLQDAIADNAPQAEINALQRRVLGLAAAEATATARQSSINGLRQAQDLLETQIDLSREALEGLRITLTDALYANLAQLMLHLFPRAQRPQAAAFFDLELLQQTGPEEEEPPVIPPVPPVV